MASKNGVTVANAFVQVMPSMEGATDNITKAILPGIEDAGGKAGSMFGNVFSGKAGTAMKALGGAMVGMFAVDAMADTYSEVEAGLNNLKIATGATGEAAKELEGVYLDVSKNVVGSFEDIGSAVGELNTRFGLQGEELEKASEQAMKYAKVTGQDATQAIQDVTRMMNDANIPASEYSNVLDKLTVASQASGIDVSKLTTAVTDNSASFKELGLSTDDAIAMLAQFERSGANTSQILAGMKKGVAEWTKEGKSAKDGFAEFVKGVQDGTVTSADAIEIFGSRAGMVMYDAAQKGQLSFDEMYKAINDNSEGALDDIYKDTLTASEKFDVLVKNLQAGFFELIEPLVDVLGPILEDVLGIATEVIGVLVEILKPFFEMLSEGISKLREWLDPLFAAIGDAINNVVVPALSSLFSWVNDNIIPVFEWFAGVLETVFGWLKDVADAISNAIDLANDFNQANTTYSTSDADPWNSGYYGHYASGGFAGPGELYVANERGGEFIWPSYEPYLSMYADAISSRIDAPAQSGVTVVMNVGTEGEFFDWDAIATNIGRQVSNEMMMQGVA